MRAGLEVGFEAPDDVEGGGTEEEEGGVGGHWEALSLFA